MIGWSSDTGRRATCDAFNCRVYVALSELHSDGETLCALGWGIETTGLEGAETVRHYCPEHKTEMVHSDVAETVDHPRHYGGEDNPYEAIKVIEAWGLGFCLGNTVKYIARHEHKGSPLEDLKKARWYLQREIERLGGK